MAMKKILLTEILRLHILFSFFFFLFVIIYNWEKTKHIILHILFFFSSNKVILIFFFFARDFFCLPTVFQWENIIWAENKWIKCKLWRDWIFFFFWSKNMVKILTLQLGKNQMFLMMYLGVKKEDGNNRKMIKLIIKPLLLQKQKKK